MIREEFSSADGRMQVDYVKGYIKRENTNKIWCHPQFELLVIVRGNITYNDKKGVTKISDKSVVFFKAHEVHNPCVDETALYERYRVIFFGDAANEILSDSFSLNKELSVSYKKGLSDADFNEILGYIKSLYDIVRSGEEDKLRERIYLISLLMKGASVQPRIEAVEKNYISDVVEYIKSNFNTRLTAESLASRFYVSRGKLIYDFKDYCDMTLLEYVTLTRLEAAKEMLLSGYSVSAASEACGFSSPSYFIKVFSGIVGMTPLKFQTNFSQTH